MKKNHPWRVFQIKNKAEEQSIKDYNSLMKEQKMSEKRIKNATLSRA